MGENDSLACFLPIQFYSKSIDVISVCNQVTKKNTLPLCTLKILACILSHRMRVVLSLLFVRFNVLFFFLTPMKSIRTSSMRKVVPFKWYRTYVQHLHWHNCNSSGSSRGTTSSSSNWSNGNSDRIHLFDQIKWNENVLKCINNRKKDEEEKNKKWELNWTLSLISSASSTTWKSNK